MWLVLLLCLGYIPAFWGPVSAAALELNGGFEDGLTGWTQTAGSGGVSVTDEQKASGASSLKIVDASGSTTVAVESAKFNALPGNHYTVTGQVYLQSGATAVSLRFYDSSNAVIGTPSSAYMASLGAWTGFNIAAEAPANAVKWSIYISTGNSNTGTSYYDDIRAFESATAVLPFQDTFDSESLGSTPDAYAAYGAGTVTVSDTPGGGNRSLTLHDQQVSNSGVAAIRPIQAVTSGTVEFETKFLYAPDSTQANQRLAVNLKVMGKTAAGQAQPAAQFRILRDGLAKVASKAGFNDIPNGNGTSTAHWYMIRFVINLNTKKFDIYMTSDVIQPGSYVKAPAKVVEGMANTVVIEDREFQTDSIVSLNNITLETADNSGTLYIDYVKMIRKLGGVVKDDQGAFITGANVKLYEAADTGFANPIASAITGTEGEYLFDPSIEIGNYVLRATKAGYLALTKPVTVSTSGPGNTDLTLVADPGYVVYPVSGSVTESGTGSPISDADVKLYEASDAAFLNPIASAVTGMEGGYTLNDITSGSYVIRVVKAGYITATKPLTVTSSGVGNADLTMSEDPEAKQYTIGGKVFEASSKAPIAGAVVKLYGDADINFTSVLGTGTTSADGSFTISPNMFDGRYRLKAELNGYYSTTSPVAVWKSDMTDEVIAMPVKELVTVEAMPKPPAEHPRLYLRRSDIGPIKEKMKDPLLKKVWEQVLLKSEAGSYTAKSSGTTEALETYTLPSVQQARYVRILAKGNTQGIWNSILETKIYGQPQAGQFTSLPIQDVKWSTAPSSANDGWKSIDGNLTTYWTAEGSVQWIAYDLGSLQDIHAIALAWFKGNQRTAFFDIDVSADGEQWSRIDMGMGPSNPGQLPPRGANKTNFSKAVRESIEAAALRYVLLNDVDQGNQAVLMMKNFLNSVDFSNPNQYHQIGDTINMAAIVYDWCYPLMFDTERDAVVIKMKALANYSEIGYDNLVTNAVEGHPSESMVMKDLFAAGVAVYERDTEIYEKAAGAVFNKYVPVRNFWYESGMHHQGDSYGMQGRYEPELWSQIITRRMGHEDLFTEKQGDVLMRAIYTRRPDGQLLRDGDSYQDVYTIPNVTWKYETVSMLAASQYENPYVRDMFLKEYVPGSVDAVMEMLLVPSNMVSRPVDDLPLTQYFGSPMGSMVARTGWDDPVGINKNSPSVVAEMKIGGYWFGNHQHLDMGSFQLYYQGSLAVDSGMYSGVLAPGQTTTQDYGSDHDRNYFKRTIAHNSMLVYDPSEVFRYRGWQLDNDGGQRWANSTYAEAHSLEQLVGKDYSRAKVTGHEYGTDPYAPEYSYIKGDLTQAYSDKVKQFERSMMFFNLKDSTHPAAMVVFDKVVSKDSSFEKYWLLHSMEKPEVNGSAATITRNNSDYSGKLVNETLLPLNASVDIVGDHDYNFQVFDTSYDQWPLEPPNLPPGQYTIEQGAYRVEVKPTIKAETDYFLNVMQVMDSGQTVTLPTRRLDADLMTGAQIDDRAVWFSKSGKRLNQTVTLSAYGSQPEMMLTVADLQQGKWRISMAGKPDQFGEVSDEGGVLAFHAPAGSYTLTPLGMIDDVAPSTRAIIYGDTGAGTFNNHAVTVKFEANDKLSGVKKTEYRLNGGAWTTFADSVSLSGSGIYTLEYRSEDNAGHVEAAKQAVVGVDTIQPTVVWSGIAEGGVYSSPVTPTAAATDELSGIASVTYKLNGAPWTAGGAISALGNHILEAVATDLAGNKTTSTVKFAIQAVAGSSVTLSDPQTVRPGEVFTLQLGIAQAVNISALDIKLSYDKAVFEYVGAESDRTGTSIARTQHDDVNGTLRFLVANAGTTGVMNGDSPALRLQLRAKAEAAGGSGVIAVTQAVQSDGQGAESSLGLVSRTIQVVNQVTKAELLEAIAGAVSLRDTAVEGTSNGQFVPGTLTSLKTALTSAITGAQAVANQTSATQAAINQAASDLQAAVGVFESGRIVPATGNVADPQNTGITVGDLGFVALRMWLTEASSEWAAAKAADINKDGTIDIFDLTFIALRVE
ncbi:Cohesin domain-containing protein [Paenibacillus sp. UNCCL117]|nr:Cohesin domain-containing protein [Paenibacillus sp. cl123]SFW59994.1 Cohesin domain-containing protein [Paenibacillus sp. UNCCL117]